MSGKIRWFSMRLMIAVGIYAVVYTVLNVSLTRGIEAEKRWLREQGLPASPEELVKPPFSPDVKPEEDARPPFEAAAALWQGIPETDRDWLSAIEFRNGSFRHLDDCGAPLPEEQVGRLKGRIEDHAMILRLLGEAADRPTASRSVDYRKGPAARLSNVGYARHLGHFAGLAAAVKACEGDRSAYASWNVSLGASTGISGDHTLVSFLVQVAMEKAACKTLQGMLDICDADASDLEMIARRIARLPDPRPAYQRAMMAEEAGMGIMIYESWLEGSVSSVNPGGSASGAARIWLEADYLTYLKLFRRFHEHRNDPPWKSFAESLFSDEFFRREVPVYAPLVRCLMPALDSIRRHLVVAEAERLAIRYGVQLARHRLAAGAYPETLDGLAPDLAAELPDPVDPCTGKTLVYRREGEGFVLYSLGKNQKDNGGLAAEPGKMEIPADADDIAFRLTK